MISKGHTVGMVARTQGLGYTPQTQSIVSSSLSTAAAVDPEPISKAALAVAALVSKLFGFGYNPRKLNDTAVTEGVQLVLHNYWYQLTGEDLGGVQQPVTPGEAGEQHVAIFTESAYPNVPGGASGYALVDVNQLIAEAQNVMAQGRAALIRQESFSAYDANTGYLLGLFNQVAEARAAGSSFNFLADSNGEDVSNYLPWVLGGLLAWGIL